MNLLKNEFEFIEELVKKSPDIVDHEVLDSVKFKNKSYDIHSFSIGPKDPEVPVLALFGGVHGLEQFGSHVVIAYLNYVIERLHWDKNFAALFEKVRLVSIPIVNPVGFKNFRRSNGNGVDLMRNSPVSSKEKVFPILGGQLISSKIPWYRGDTNQMEKESQLMCDFVKDNVINSKNAISIDFHSGFGFKDRLWYPYACSKKKFDGIDNLKRIESLLDRTLPHHIYKVEPQSDHYTTHGDLWDYLYFHKKEHHPTMNYLPLTLEMGSWIWLKKNPLQLFSKLGLFNPIKDHRFNRAMRRHFLMIDFFLKAAANPDEWTA